MHTIWDGRREVRELRARMDQAFRMACQQQPCRPGHLAPPVDFVVAEDGFHVTLDVPGVSRDSLSVQIERGALVITGEKAETEPAEGRVLRRERRYGTFRRALALPDEADLGEVSAKLSNGELHIKIGRQAQAAPRRVEVVVE